MDQSDNNLTEAFLQPYLREARVRYFKAGAGGVAVSRNTGVRHAGGVLVALTDDDCTVPRAWLSDFVDAFQTDSRIAMVFGNVLAGPHQSELGFVQAYVRNQPFVARGIRDRHRVEGIGACMALRRSVWEELGGFDEMLGAGGAFKSAEETDFAVRVLLAGYRIYETPNGTCVTPGQA